ncbi:MAG: hypothetical protein WC797_04500 [Candidatus Paceibacterota bacterium]|jgi:hypothetical protein
MARRRSKGELREYLWGKETEPTPRLSQPAVSETVTYSPAALRRLEQRRQQLLQSYMNVDLYFKRLRYPKP